MTEDPEDDLQWLRYWVVLATVHMIELVVVIVIIIMINAIITTTSSLPLSSTPP